VAHRATSLEIELGRAVDRGEVLAHTLVAVARWYRALLESRYDDVLQAWRRAAPSASGTTVEWTTPQGVQTGVTAGIDDTGALLVRTAIGVERLIAGEVTWTL
jgi:BirA family biotin operon repressor/biotin-[acetyl-CoA-carboxylase] ligase